MPAAEVQLLLGDLRGELEASDDSPAAPAAVARYQMLLEEFAHDWRQLCALHGEDGAGLGAFRSACEALRNGSRQMGAMLVMRTNRVAAHQVLEARVLRHLIRARRRRSLQAPASARRPAPSLREPVFIVASPRSGSTLLFETLAAHGAMATLGGEAHWLFEGEPELRPGICHYRLQPADRGGTTLPPWVSGSAPRSGSACVDSTGQPAGDRALRFLEKTPKNALRIPFLRQLFPDARFIFLWRDPRENISSIIEAWRSGNWITYPELAGWDGPWSLLLPPQWQLQQGRPLEEIAAWQWDSANRYICDDLAALPREHWTVVRYDELRDSRAGNPQSSLCLPRPGQSMTAWPGASRHRCRCPATRTRLRRRTSGARTPG